MKTTATFAKLKTGRWGLRVSGNCSAGMKVEVRKKDGTVHERVIGKIVSRWDDYYFCEIATEEQAEKLATRPNSSGRFVTYSKIPVPPDSNVIPFDPPYKIRK